MARTELDNRHNAELEYIIEFWNRVTASCIKEHPELTEATLKIASEYQVKQVLQLERKYQNSLRRASRMDGLK
jgi:hypothetical protein